MYACIGDHNVDTAIPIHGLLNDLRGCLRVFYIQRVGDDINAGLFLNALFDSIEESCAASD